MIPIITLIFNFHRQQLKTNNQYKYKYNYKLKQQIILSSTMEQLIKTIKQNPNQLKVLTKILQQLLKQKYSSQQKHRIISQLVVIITKINAKINKKQQAHTYKFVGTVTQKLTEIIIQIIISQSNTSHTSAMDEDFEFSMLEPTAWPQIITNLIKIYRHDSQLQQELVKIVVNHVISNQIDSTLFIDGQVLLFFLGFIKKSKLCSSNTFQNVLKLLMQIQHFNQLKFTESRDQEKKGSNLFNQNPQVTQFKSMYQQLLIECLTQVQKLDIQEQVNIYRKFGEKIFSKLANPLILSQFFLMKMKSYEENPAIQIQVLSSLFILVGKYGLQLQKYYENLQKIIGKKRSSNQSLFQLKNSRRFLKLVEASMRSSKVPFKTVLNLCHLVLNSIMNEKSQFIYWALSFFVNLVKKHRQLQNHLSEFPQIESLKHHYSPVIRSLVKQLSKNLNKSQYLDIQDFAKVNCRKLLSKKFTQISNKIENNQEKLQFKVSLNFDKL